MYKSMLLATLMFISINAFVYEKCPQMVPMPLFDINKFTGVWYAVQSGNDIPACDIFKIVQSGEPLSYIMSTETRVKTAHQKYRTKSTETLTVLDTDFLAKMSVSPLPRESLTFPLRFGHIVESNFTVVNTDYETYAVVFRNDGFVMHSYIEGNNYEDCSGRAYFWSRTPALSGTFLRKMNKIIQNQALESILFNVDSIKNQTGCTDWYDWIV